MPNPDGSLTYDEMVAHAIAATEKTIPNADAHKAKVLAELAARKQAEVLAAKQAAASSPTHFRDQLELAQAAYRNAQGTGIALSPPSQDLISAAQAEAARENAPAAIGNMSSSQPDVSPGSPLGDARELEAPNLARGPNELDIANAMSMGVSGPSAQALNAAQAQFDQAGKGVRAGQAQVENAIYDAQIGAQQANEAAKLKTNADIAQNAEMSPLLEKQAKETADYEIAVKQAAEAATEATNRQMARVRQSADEAANAQIKDFWADKSTAGRIIGIISQAFAGAANGLSGQPGAPTPLDRIIERDLQVQQINLNNKTTTSYREQGILGLLNKQHETQQAALTAAHMAAIAHVDALGKQIAQKYNTPKALAEYQSFHAANLQKYADVEARGGQVIANSNLQSQQVASGILERGLSANAALGAKSSKATGIENRVLGLKEPVNVQQYHQLAPFADSLAVELNANEKILELLKKPDLKNANWRQQLENYASDTFAARRIDQRTGARLEGEEAKRVEVAVPSIKKDLFDNITPRALYDFQQEIQNNIRHDVGLYAKRAQAVTGRYPDLNDPIIGHHLRAMATQAAPNG